MKKLELKKIMDLAESGDADAQLKLGNHYYHSKYREDRDLDKSVYWYEAASAQGHLRAKKQLAGMYEFGIGVKVDDHKAFELYKESAEGGIAESQANLGRMYKNGKGVIKNEASAREWFMKAGMQGFLVYSYLDKEDLYNLGVMFATGDGVVKDDVYSYGNYKAAAMKGHLKSQYALGLMCIDDSNIYRSDKDAIKWFTMAAEQGHDDAKNHLDSLVN